MITATALRNRLLRRHIGEITDSLRIIFRGSSERPYVGSDGKKRTKMIKLIIRRGFPKNKAQNCAGLIKGVRES